MREHRVEVKRDVALYTSHFTATHDPQGVWDVRQIDHFWSDGSVPSWVVWFDRHATDNNRHVFWDEGRDSLRCSDEHEAEALLRQLEAEFKEFCDAQ